MICLLKKKVLKIAVSVAVFVLAVLTTGSLDVFASGEFDIQSQYEVSGAEGVLRALPDSVQKQLDSVGIDAGNISTAQSLRPDGVLHSVIRMTGDEVKTPLAALGLVMALLLFASVCRGGENAQDSPLSPSLNAVTSLAAGITLVIPAASLMNSADEAAQTACRFTESFGTVFAGILIANGQTASAAGYSAFLTGAVNAASLCASEIVMPMLRIFLALSCVSAVSPNVRIDAVIRFFEKYAKWLLGFTAMLISTVLSISGIISASADSVGARAAKFVISGSVPVVGGAMSDAYLSIKSGMTLLRNSTGAFGIIATAYIFLPVILRTLLWSFVAGIGEAVSDTMNLSDLQKLMKSLSATFSLLLGVVVFSLFLLTLGGIIVIMQRSA